MKRKARLPKADSRLPVSKQTAGGVAGAVLGSVVAGPVGAVIGAVAGTMMGNRAAEGKSLVSPATAKTAKSAMKTVGNKLPALKGKLPVKSKAPSAPARKRAVAKPAAQKTKTTKAPTSRKVSKRK